jgi:hypothetical protein
MTKLEQIEKTIAELSPQDVAKLQAWLEEYRAELWDRQIEADAKAGKLDKLAERALAHHRAGRTKRLRDISPRRSFGRLTTPSMSRYAKPRIKHSDC